MSGLQEQKRFFCIPPLKFRYGMLIFGIILGLLLVAWYLTFSPSDWAKTPNYFAMYINFILTRPVDAFLTISTGPGNAISRLVILAYGFPIFLIVLHWIGNKKRHRFVIMNGKYFVYVIALCLATITLQNAAQYYEWYMNNSTMTAGYVDTWTHIVSPLYVGALLAPLALERVWGWDRKLFWVPIATNLTMVALGWEIAENIDLILRPSAYFNYPMDSLKDLIFGAVISSIMSSWIYERIVIDWK